MIAASSFGTNSQTKPHFFAPFCQNQKKLFFTKKTFKKVLTKSKLRCIICNVVARETANARVAELADAHV